MNRIRIPDRPVCLTSHASVVGRREHEGPFGSCFDLHDTSDRFGQKTWEQAESEMQRLALNTALSRRKCTPEEVDLLLAGDLLNQCVGSSYGLVPFGIPYLGIFGACSTAVEGLGIASLLVGSGASQRAAAVCSSHNCSAERQFRSPLEYGGQRPPTAQWTVTGAAAFLVEPGNFAPCIREVLFGRPQDYGITDANNMGAAMAPAAADTLSTYFFLTGKKPEDFDAIVTGDLGYEGSGILLDLLSRDGIDISQQHKDCGLMIYDRDATDVHAGGSGCGCCGTMLAGHFYGELQSGRLQNILFLATGALMNAASLQQGLSIPGIAHLIHLTAPESNVKQPAQDADFAFRTENSKGVNL